MKSHELFTKNHAFVPWRAFEVQVRKRLGFLWYEGELILFYIYRYILNESC